MPRCCARAASGQITIPPPTAAMSPRRLTRLPRECVVSSIFPGGYRLSCSVRRTIRPTDRHVLQDWCRRLVHHLVSGPLFWLSAQCQLWHFPEVRLRRRTADDSKVGPRNQSPPADVLHTFPAVLARGMFTAALRGRIHDRTRSSPAPFKRPLASTGHPYMTSRGRRRRKRCPLRRRIQLQAHPRLVEDPFAPDPGTHDRFVRYQPSTQSRFLTDDEVNRTWPDVLLTRLSCE